MIKDRKIKWYNSLKIKLYIILLIIIILPIIIFGIKYKKELKKEVEASILKQNTLVSNKVANTVLESIGNIEYSIRSVNLTSWETLVDGELLEKEEVLFGLFKVFPHLEELKLVGQTGKEETRISKRKVITKEELEYIGDREEFKLLKTTKDYIGKPRMEDDNNIVFDLGIPIVRNNKEFSGGIIAKISLRQIMKEISSIELPEGTYVMLVDEEGELFGHTDFSQVLRGENVLDSVGVREVVKLRRSDIKPILNEFTTSIYDSYSGKKVLGVYGLIPILNWGVVVEQPLEQSHRRLNNILRNYNIILSSIISIIILLGTIIIYKFLEPIDALSRGVKEVNKGNYNYQIPYKNKDEIGVAIEAFNDMILEIKKKREAEELLIRAEKKVAIGILAAGVAHEINNPMNNLAFYTSDLLDRIETENIEELVKENVFKEYIEETKKQIDRCTSITQSLLNFSRESEMKAQNLNLNNIVEDTLKLLSHRIKKEKIEIIKKYNGEFHIYAENSWIQQIILNLLTNAIDAIEGGGQVTIELKIDEKTNATIIKITDTGVGMETDQIPRVFDLFYTTKPIGKGTGLGLSIALELVERLRGSMEIHSERNKGTTVMVSLPRYMESETNGFI